MATVLCEPLVPETALPGEPAVAEGRTQPPVLNSARHPLPELGFCGFAVSGIGEYVLSVDPDGAAEQIGLEAGDMILALNGNQLAREGDWDQAMAHAAASDGRVTLKVRSGRTGNIAEHTCYVFSGVLVAAAQG